MKKSLRSWVLFLPFFTLPLCSASTLNQGNQVANQVAAEKPALDSDGQKKWWKAIEIGDVGTIERLLRKYKVDLSEKTDKGKTAFHYVAEASWADPKDNRITKLLICGFVRQLEPKVIPNGIPSMIFAFYNYIPYQNEIFDLLLKDKEEKTKFMDQPDKEGNSPLDILAKVLCIGPCIDPYVKLVKNYGVNPSNMLDELAKKGALKAFKLFIKECGADINTRNKAGKTPLYAAAYGGIEDMFRYLVQHPEVDLSKKTDYGWTIAHEVASSDDVPLLELLKERIEKDSKQEKNPNKVADSFNQRDSDGETPFFVAVFHGYKEEVLQFLVEKCSADPNIPNNDGETAFYHEAVVGLDNKHERLPMCEFLVKVCGANPNIPDNYGRTDFHRILVDRLGDKDNKKAWRFLVKSCNMDPNIPDIDGRTPFYIAARFYREELCKFLVDECNANPNIQDNYGRTVFSTLAVRFGENDKEMCKFLVKKCNANPNIPNKNGETVFFTLAVRFGENDKEMCKFLVEECNANPNIPNNAGKTVVDIAREKGNDDMYKFLVEECNAEELIGLS